MVYDAKDISSIQRYRRFGVANRDGLPEVSRSNTIGGID